MADENPLPVLKKPVKFTPASLRLMQACEKAFASNNFLLLYFTNSKTFTQQFVQPDFQAALRNKFQFLQLSRADRAGNWLTTIFHVKCSPYYAILDPSNGEYLEMRYGDLDTPTVHAWLQSFVSRAPKFTLSRSIFTDLIQDAQSLKKRSAFAYGTKIRLTVVSQGSEEKVIYINKSAPLEIAFEKYCGERGIDPLGHYFLYRGVELPPTMSASQMGLRNGSVVHVHPLEDKVSTEPLSVTVVGPDGASSVFNVTRGRKLGGFLKSYCELSGVNPAQVRMTFNSDPVHDELTFAEHSVKNGDQLFVHHRIVPPANEFMYSLVPPPPNVPRVPQMQLPGEQFELPMAGNPMFYFNQPQRPGPLPPQPFPPGYGQAYPMPPAKSGHYQKPHDSGTGGSIWESFDMPMP
jgi:hypothetical protein